MLKLLTLLKETMNHPFDLKESVNKKELVSHWLEANLSQDYCDDREKPSNLYELTKDCSSPLLLLNSPSRVKNLKASSTCSSQVSPVLGGKRLAFGGGKKNLKRLKLDEKSDFTNETKNTESFELPFQVENLIEKQDKVNASKVKVSEYENIMGNFQNQEHSNDDSREISKSIEFQISQLIESISSKNEDHENSQKVSEVSDKTESDLIENITQMTLEITDCEKCLPLSLNISNPSSDSSHKENNDTNLNKSNIKKPLLETCTSTEPIDTVSSLEIKEDIGKIPFILPFREEKPKRKKNTKKSILLELLTKTMAKESSSVKLFRHRLQKQSNSTVNESFVLFQIIRHLPKKNGNQFFKCALISDSMDLLNFIPKNIKNNLMTIMSIPEISDIVNVNQKPILKVYEPMTVLDPNQFLLCIIKFIAISPEILEDFKLSDKTQENGHDLKVVNKFHCPCLDEKVLSIDCKSKFTETSNSLKKMLFD